MELERDAGCLRPEGGAGMRNEDGTMGLRVELVVIAEPLEDGRTG